MTHAVLFKDSEGIFNGFSVKGHSGYAEEGYDIVCAAVSILTYTCANSLDSVIGLTPMIKGGTNGFLELVLPSFETDQKKHDSQILFKALMQGFSDLSEAYPKYFEFSIMERR